MRDTIVKRAVWVENQCIRFIVIPNPIGGKWITFYSSQSISYVTAVCVFGKSLVTGTWCFYLWKVKARWTAQARFTSRFRSSLLLNVEHGPSVCNCRCHAVKTRCGWERGKYYLLLGHTAVQYDSTQYTGCCWQTQCTCCTTSATFFIICNIIWLNLAYVFHVRIKAVIDIHLPTQNDYNFNCQIVLPCAISCSASSYMHTSVT